jgi:guanine nucleotide-binding protein alpha-1 subunit
MADAQQQQQSSSRTTSLTGGSSSRATRDSTPELPPLTTELLRLKMRLSPLVQVEEELARRLSAGQPVTPSTPVAVSVSQTHAPLDTFASATSALQNDVEGLVRLRFAREVSVNSSSGWKAKLARIIHGNVRGDVSSEGDCDDGIDWDDPNDPGRVIHLCGDDIKRLWSDPVIRRLLAAQKIRLQEMSGL